MHQGQQQQILSSALNMSIEKSKYIDRAKFQSSFDSLHPE